ncbi:MAG: Bpu10I family restriction endonuclease [Gemmatimonadales bacterium]
MSGFPTPHLDKLEKALQNEKTPAEDLPRLEAAKEKHAGWVATMDAVGGTPAERIPRLVALYNEYRTYVDVDLIFSSPRDFLYRQKGQLKLDNSVLEEFLPRLFTPTVIPELDGKSVLVGPQACYSATIVAQPDQPQLGGGLTLRTKDQDFALAMPVHLRASHTADFKQAADRLTAIAYVAAECKTNLDKTMFQEACATARDVKSAVTGAKYFVLCEWLDMTPLSTAATDIDEVLILRGKRMSSNIRKDFDTAVKRQARLEEYRAFLAGSPARSVVFERLVAHVRQIFANEVPVENDVLNRGYF